MHWETNQLHSSVHEEWNIDAILFSMVNPFWGTAPNALLLLTSICVCVWWWPMVNRSCCWLVAVTLRLRMCQLFVCIGLTLHAKPSKPNRLLLALIHPTFLCSVRMVDIFAFHRSHADIWFIVDLELMWFCFGRKCFSVFWWGQPTTTIIIIFGDDAENRTTATLPWMNGARAVYSIAHIER